MTDKFGVEIEFYGLGNRPSAVADILRSHGLENVRGERYNHTTRRHWKVVTDGSVYEGIELVSPPLKFNQTSIEKVKEVFNILNESNCYVNNNCGMHVHVDATFLNGYSIEKQDKFFEFIHKTFQKHESKFDDLVASNRKNNQFAHSTIGINTYNLRRDRFHKLNLTAFARHGTIEFRQYQGTMNGMAAVAWITLCVTFMKNVRAKFEAAFNSTNEVSAPREHIEF